MLIAILFSLNLRAHARPVTFGTLSRVARTAICQSLLQRSNAPYRLPPDPGAAAILLDRLWHGVRRLGSGAPDRRLTPSIKAYARQAVEWLDDQRANREVINLFLHIYAPEPTPTFSYLKLRESSPARNLEMRRLLRHEVARLPAWLKYELKASGRGLTLHDSFITDHPSYKSFRGRRLDARNLYDDVPGMADFTWRGRAVVNAASPGEDGLTILHEALHLWDGAGADRTGVFRSDDPEYLRLHYQTKWKVRWMKEHPTESFAESLAMYLGDDRSREKLRDLYPAVFDYFKARGY